jgi:hypothetical protein
MCSVHLILRDLISLITMVNSAHYGAARPHTHTHTHKTTGYIKASHVSKFIFLDKRLEVEHGLESQISGSYGGEYEDDSLLEYCAV